MRKHVLTCLPMAWGLAFCSSMSMAQLVEDYHPSQAGCCLERAARQLAEQLQDWNQLGRYYDDNRSLQVRPPQPGRVVFLGDSITEGWHLAEFFPGKPYVNRGISGQTTPQMLVRMFPDVIDLHPAAVVILAGTNDIAGNTGPETLTMVEENVQAITELAEKHEIKAILCSLLPVSDYNPSKQTARRPPPDILKLNAWLKNYAREAHAGFADYYSALVDSQGMLDAAYSKDGLHPIARGYALMAPVAEEAIEETLRQHTLGPQGFFGVLEFAPAFSLPTSAARVEIPRASSVKKKARMPGDVSPPL